MKSPAAVVGNILRHPFNRDRRLAALWQFAKWQLTAPLDGAPREFTLFDDAKMLARRGERGVTGNLYCGLYELREMLFFMRAIRPGDRFFDVGANSGVYSVMAGALGALVEAFEPESQAYRRLLENLELNGLDNVNPNKLGVSDRSGRLRITTHLDAANHLVDGNDPGGERIDVVALDDLAPPADDAGTFCKIDVEGHERKVLAGARRFLRRPQLAALVIEVGGNRSGSARGLDRTIRALRDAGLQLVGYDPELNLLEAGAAERIDPAATSNLIWVRDRAWIAERLATAKRFRVRSKLL